MKFIIGLLTSFLLVCYLPALAAPGMPHHHAIHHMGKHMKHKMHHKGMHHKQKATEKSSTTPTSAQ